MELKTIVKQAETTEKLMGKIDKAEAKLAEQKAELRKLIEETLPGMLIENGITEIALKSGAQVGLKQIFAVNIPAAGTITKAKLERKKALIKRLNGCISWLRKHKGSAIIRSTVTCEFNAGDDKDSKELFAELRKRQFHPISAKSVHPGTLRSFLREKWDADVEIPVELFETFTGQSAEFTLPKPAKANGQPKAVPNRKG